MFELSIAKKYLIPRIRQLSISLISLVSIGVISLVVWLILVFFSVTNGLEKNWIDQLVALTSPIRITPTQAYYDSYYFQVDAFSNQANYSLRGIEEKLMAAVSDPYQNEIDPELPRGFPEAHRDGSGALIDPVKTAFLALDELSNQIAFKPSTYEIAFATLKLALLRDDEGGGQSFLNQTSYLTSFEASNDRIGRTLVPIDEADRRNLRKALKRVSREEEFSSALWLDRSSRILPSHPILGEGILCPKHFHDTGARIGDSGFLTYASPTASALQEQQIPIYIAGFYDPGILPIGGKSLIVSPNLSRLINASQSQQPEGETTGIHLWASELDRVGEIKQMIEDQFYRLGIAPYWTVETYEEYSFTRDLIGQLKSEKSLFSLIALIIIIVACSNIITLLLLLVNDKRGEIAIFRAMGASSASIAKIFGFCGMMMGIAGCLLGTLLAWTTLYNLQGVLDFLGRIQGRAVLSQTFYGEVIPNSLSSEALIFVIASTIVVSLLAGVIPALRASRVNPTEVLRGK
jgi:lipoprotein-releasing system permease protein